jgi:two-component system sensor histidine kinase UhpB
LLCGFGIAYWLLLIVGLLHWHVATGLLFLALWLAPSRAWPWIVLAAFVARWSHDSLFMLHGSAVDPLPGNWEDQLSWVLGHLLEPLLVAGAVMWLRRVYAWPASLGDLQGVVRYLLAALMMAAMLVGRDVLVALAPDGAGGLQLPMPFEAAALQQAGSGALAALVLIKSLLGYFIGCLLVVPLGTWLSDRRFHPGTGRILGEVLVLVPMALVLMGLMLVARGSPTLVDLLRLLMLAGVVVFTLRHGWRGASLALLVVSAFIALEDHLGLADALPASLQLVLALMGSVGLMFGATIDGALRLRGELDAARRRQSRLAEELHEAALRNLTVEERERQRLAVELHDEFGQNLAALQTHLKLSLPAMESAGRAGVVERLLELTRQMQHNISRVLDSLRPAALDELGLFGAIDRGSLRRLAEDSGLVFETRLEGDARLLSRLSPIHRVAAFRMAQGAVTNVVRHANARHCWLRLRANARGGQLWLFLDVRDDGNGRLDAIKPGNGLSGLQDRVIGLGGRLVISQRQPGLRVHVLLRQPLDR